MSTKLLTSEMMGPGRRPSAEILASSEAASIQAARQGDLEAFNELVHSYQDSVYWQAFHLLQERQAAEDIVQEAFLIAFRKLDTFRGGSFKAWLLRITTNLCYDELRRSKRQATIPLENYNREGEIMESPTWLTDSAESPEEAVERTELRSALQQGISQLPAKLREAVILVDIQGLKYAEAARVSSVSIGTIKSRLARARMGLRDYLCTPTQPIQAISCQPAYFGAQ